MLSVGMPWAVSSSDTAFTDRLISSSTSAFWRFKGIFFKQCVHYPVSNYRPQSWVSNSLPICASLVLRAFYSSHLLVHAHGRRKFFIQIR